MDVDVAGPAGAGRLADSFRRARLEAVDGRMGSLGLVHALPREVQAGKFKTKLMPTDELTLYSVAQICNVGPCFRLSTNITVFPRSIIPWPAVKHNRKEFLPPRSISTTTYVL